MPYGDWINELPTGFFMTVHIAAFAVGAGFAWLAYKRGLEPARRGLLAVRARRGDLHDVPPRLDRLPARSHDRRGARPARVRARLRGDGARRRPPAGTRRGAVTKRRALVAPAVAAAVLCAAACGGGDDAAEPVATNEVTMAKSYKFEPSAIRIEAGDSVTWTNDDNFTHTVRGRGPGQTTRSTGATASRSGSPSRARTTTSARCTAATWTGRWSSGDLARAPRGRGHPRVRGERGDPRCPRTGALRGRHGRRPRVRRRGRHAGRRRGGADATAGRARRHSPALRCSSRASWSSTCRRSRRVSRFSTLSRSTSTASPSRRRRSRRSASSRRPACCCGAGAGGRGAARSRSH